MSAMHEAGCGVPGDIAVIGYDDIPIARYAMPPLTTMHLPAHDMGRACGEMAIAAIEGDGTGARVRTFESRLIVRHSCGAIPASQPLAE